MVNSGFLNGLEVAAAIPAINEKIEAMGIGSTQVNYKMRDANFSRQRYWGEPFPIVYDQDGIAQAVPLDQLPLELPETDDFKPGKGGKSPLSRIDNWVNLPNGHTRETDTMPAVAGSSWYYLRYMDPGNDEAFAGQDAVGYWRDVDVYIGGSEHAVAHLMYARFWHKFLYDKGLVPTNEPFKKLINQGMIQGVIEFIFLQKDKVNGQSRFISAELKEKEAGKEFVRIPVHIDFVSDYGSDKSFLDQEGIRRFRGNGDPNTKTPFFESAGGIYHRGVFTATGATEEIRMITHSEVGKMSKSKYNVINPDLVIDQYGTDCFRMYEMFLGPIEQAKPWDTKGIDGVSKFLRRFWGMYFDEDGKFIADDTSEPAKGEWKILHAAIKKVTEDIERFNFNTCVSAFMVATNELRKENCRKRSILEQMALLIAPFAPHLADELWQHFGHSGSIHHAGYPEYDPAYLVEAAITYPISVNGKKRALVELPADAAREELELEALKLEAIQKWIEGKTVRKVIVVPKRMINIVVG